MFGRKKQQASYTENRAERQISDALYEMVAEEMKNGVRREGIWLKAFADSGGDEKRAQALYIEARLVALVDEIAMQAEQDAKRIEHAKSVVGQYEAASRRAEVMEENGITMIGLGVICFFLACIGLLGFSLSVESFLILFLLGGLALAFGGSKKTGSETLKKDLDSYRVDYEDAKILLDEHK